MREITLEDAEHAYTVGVIVFDLHKHIIMRHSVKTGIQYEVRHYSYPPIFTSHLSEAVDYYNQPLKPPAGWQEIGHEEDQTAKRLAAIEAMGYVWDGSSWNKGEL